MSDWNMNWIRMGMNIKKFIDGLLRGIVRIKILTNSKNLENPREDELVQNTEQNEKMVQEYEVSKNRIIASVRSRPPL